MIVISICVMHICCMQNGACHHNEFYHYNDVFVIEPKNLVKNHNKALKHSYDVLLQGLKDCITVQILEFLCYIA